MKKTKTKSFADISIKFLEKPFKAGGRGPDGYDCAGFCFAFLKEMDKAEGLEKLWKWGEYDLNNYATYYKKNLIDAEKVMMEIINRTGTEIPLTSRLAGDLVVVQNEKGHYYPGIYVGNCRVMASFTDAGVRTVDVDGKLVKIIKVRRL